MKWLEERYPRRKRRNKEENSLADDDQGDPIV